MNPASASAFPSTLITPDPETGFALAVQLARLGVKSAQPDIEVLQRLRSVYAENADSLIASSQVVATHFQTIAVANHWWRNDNAGDAS